MPVFVHEVGAPHMAAPERLVASAARLYGGEEGLRDLWGEVVPVPEANLHVLTGGETVLGDFRVAYTPGHARHHVAYLHEPSGMAFVGDVAGVRIPPAAFVVAPTPPPDVDVEAWDRSLDLVAGWAPAALGLTHFGRVDDVGDHLDRMRERLHEAVRLAARTGRRRSRRACASASRRARATWPTPTCSPRRPSSSSSGCSATSPSAPPDLRDLVARPSRVSAPLRAA